MNINKKILQYLEIKGVSQRKFSLMTSTSDGLLRKGGNISSEKLIVIRNKFPDLNMNWLLFNDGEMLLQEETGLNKPVAQPVTSPLQTNCMEQLIQTQQQLIKAQNEIINLTNQLKTPIEKKVTGN